MSRAKYFFISQTTMLTAYRRQTSRPTINLSSERPLFQKNVLPLVTSASRPCAKPDMFDQKIIHATEEAFVMSFDNELCVNQTP